MKRWIHGVLPGLLALGCGASVEATPPPSAPPSAPQARGSLAAPTEVEGTTEQVATAPRDPALEEPEELGDREIALAIRSALEDAQPIPAAALEVEVQRGVVTLRGSVPHLLAARWAIERTQAIRGVTAIVDAIDVEPPSRPDGRLRAEIRQALGWDPVTEGEVIEVVVEDQVAILHGVVSSRAAAEVADRVTAGVTGVKEVRRELQVREREDAPADEPTADDALREAVHDRLRADAWVEAGEVDVEVTEGLVRLTGLVGSVRERARAIHVAWIGGVEAVDAEGLEVEWWGRDRFRDAPPGDDDAIAEDVRAALLEDPRVVSYEPEVTVQDGVVTLTGAVGNAAAERAAIDDARGIEGVRRVESELQVRGEGRISDRALARRVRRALSWEPHVEMEILDVRVEDGVVTLEGEVASRFFEEQLLDRVARIAGVTGVENELERAPRPPRPDEALTDDVRYRLVWSPYVSPETVDVSVANGEVTLTGTVPSFQARVAALEAAEDAGAARVVDRLRREGDARAPNAGPARPAPSPAP